MRVTVNGEPRDIAAKTLNRLLDELDFAHTQVAIAVNFAVVPRARWPQTELNSGDQIEILTPRQGG